MKLKTLISILLKTRSNIEAAHFGTVKGVQIFFWKTREELLQKIEDTFSSFEDSTDLLNNPEVIVDSILQMTDKISIYQREEIREEELIKKVPKEDVELIDTLNKIILKRNAEESLKDGSFTIELNKDELYELFSLEEWRQKQLNQLI